MNLLYLDWYRERIIDKTTEKGLKFICEHWESWTHLLKKWNWFSPFFRSLPLSSDCIDWLMTLIFPSDFTLNSPLSLRMQKFFNQIFARSASLRSEHIQNVQFGFSSKECSTNKRYANECDKNKNQSLQDTFSSKEISIN